ncbi:MAG: gamma-glutamyltransferase [Proteobacteria bacterium]|nr:gamma-glutamyltransferase [Pseudomonadota bacterium]
MNGRGGGLASAVLRSLLVLAVALAAAVGPSTHAQQRPPAEAAGGVAVKRATVGVRHMAAAANPLAAEIGREILRQGGSAVDAAIAIQMVLTLVEPQSSGIGGGAFLVHYDASKQEVTTYDGREIAPAAATADMFLDAQGDPLPFAEAYVGGLSVGTPGLIRMLELAHHDHGRLPWPRLFQPAIQAAKDGFPISQRLAKLIADTPQLKDSAAAAAYFLDQDGNPRAAGARLVNEALAETLRIVANGGADAFYTGVIARDVVTAVQESPSRPGRLTLDDLAGYHAVKRDPVCGPYRAFRICGMGPPSSGGIAVLQILGILEEFNVKSLPSGSLRAVHVLNEASRLAFADRARYVADSDFVPVPVRGLVDPRYLAKRAKLISFDRAMAKVEPGLPADHGFERRRGTVDDALELPATSHVSVIDTAGNAVAMTTSIENAFGSHIFVRGFLLNNQLTDFAFRPAAADGQPVANRVEPNKRPRSSMAPTIVTDLEGRLTMTLGSVGGPWIIPYVAKTIVGVIDWGLDIQQAIALPHHVNNDTGIGLERDTSLVRLAPQLRALGHKVELNSMDSGTQGIAVIRLGPAPALIGGADPRREGEAYGD